MRIRRGGLRSKLRGKYRGRVMRRLRRKAGSGRRYQGIKYFTEMFSAGTLSTYGTSGWFTSTIDSVPNHPAYEGLFDLGTITRFDVMLVPKAGDVVQGSSSIGGYITFSENQNPFSSTYAFVAPSTQLSILSESNARIVPLDGKRTIKIKCYHPQPAASETLQPLTTSTPPAPQGPAVVAHRKSWTWMNMNNSDANLSPFGGIRYWITGNAAEAYDVYYRVYLAFKEQQ